MLYNYAKLFFVFLMYSIIGYVIEVVSASLTNKKFCPSRGFLIGPYLPVFGFGSLIITTFISKYSDDYITIFILGMFSCCLIEYITSYVLEKTFGLRWWDYSDRKFNLNGRINLTTGIKFGLGSIFLLKILNPLLFKLFNIIPDNLLIIISIVMTFLLILDTVVSSYIIAKLKIDTRKYFRRDATEDIKEKVRESLRKYKVFYSRILHAFPNLSLDNKKFERMKGIIRRKNRK